MSLPAGVTILADAAEDLVLREVEVAHFDREDILPPARGFCLFGKAWGEDSLATVDAVFFEEGGRLLRLDVVPNSLLLQRGARDGTCRADAATSRRTCGDTGSVQARQSAAVCRGRYAFVDPRPDRCCP